MMGSKSHFEFTPSIVFLILWLSFIPTSFAANKNAEQVAYSKPVILIRNINLIDSSGKKPLLNILLDITVRLGRTAITVD